MHKPFEEFAAGRHPIQGKFEWIRNNFYHKAIDMHGKLVSYVTQDKSIKTEDFVKLLN